MTRFGSILLIHDESPGFESVLTKAAALARRDGGRLTILAATPRPTSNLLDVLRGPSPAKTVKTGAEGNCLEDSVAGAVERARNFGVTATGVLLEGKPRDDILGHVIDHRYDLVIVPDRPTPAFEGLFSERFATRILRLSPCPVWIMKPHAEARFRRIVAALEIAATDGPPDGTDLAILAFAERLAQLEGGKLDIVHAWDFKGRDLETSRSELTPPLREALYRRNRAASARALGETLAGANLGGIDYEAHLLKGNPDEVLPRFAKENETDLIVAGMKGRTGMQRLAFGDRLERISPLVHCPVVAIKPAVAVSKPATVPSRTAGKPLILRPARA